MIPLWGSGYAGADQALMTEGPNIFGGSHSSQTEPTCFSYDKSTQCALEIEDSAMMAICSCRLK